MTGTRICIIGASSGPGAALALRLLKEGRAVSGVGRNKKKMLGFDRLAKSKFGQSIQWHEIDLKDKELLAPVLEGIEIVVDCADPHYSPSIVGNLSSTVRKYVLLGSARAFSLVPDRRAEDCRVAERAVRESGVTWTVLHPTVIYGGEGGGGAIDRLVSLVRR